MEKIAAGETLSLDLAAACGGREFEKRTRE
jgi:hypothetical protein